MPKQQLSPNTTLAPVPVVLISCGAAETANVFTLNRIASCNAEPPMISISVRPARASHDLIDQTGQFVVNIPTADMEILSDFVGSTTIKETAKWDVTGLTPVAASVVDAPLLAECPVNLECEVRHTLRLPSHSLFVAEVVAIHAESQLLDARGDVDFNLFNGMVYRSAVVRERPVDNFKPAVLRAAVEHWRDGKK